MLPQFIHDSGLLAPDFRSFQRQELTFVKLNLSLLVALLSVHLLFPAYLGEPSTELIAVLSAGLVANAADLVWIKRVRHMSPSRIIAFTAISISLNIAVAFALATLSYRQDVQYFALMIGPIFQAAFRLSFSATILTVAASNSLIFFWVWNYFRLHPPADFNEYLEAGTIAVIYSVAGILVWTLVNFLRAKQAELSRNIRELEQTRARLLIEEKLAAVGRFSSAIAHEIRNPVAMISSALTTAFANPTDSPASLEMFDIAAKEASRLEKLTADFLAYARPRSPSKCRSDVADSIVYIADVCRPRATESNIAIHAEAPEGLWSETDSAQLQQALLNLVMNAIEAAPPGSAVRLRGSASQDIRIDIENEGGPIPSAASDHIFEPFFTTKSSGTGLGLAIARSIALSLGGDLALSQNGTTVRFSLALPAYTERQDTP